jgi:Ca2+-binding RTX toxin-like protein
MSRTIHLDDSANNLELGDVVDKWRLSVLGHGGDDVISFSSARWDVYLFGGDGRDYLRAGTGRDVRLDGGEGPDTMVGAEGRNSFYVDRPGDLVVDETRDDHDFVFSTISYRLPRNVECLKLEGFDASTGEGNGLDNTIVGSYGDNLILGKAGDDQIDVRLSGGSRDTVVGGLGADTMSAWYRTRFVYTDASESDMEHGVDSIHAWRSRNKIDLRLIDANSATPDVNDRFVFIGTEAFRADATGQVRYEVVGPNRCAILVSTDADADAEMRIDLLGILPAADIFAL